MATVTTSKRFSLNLQDWQKALIIAVLTPVITTVIKSLDAGVFVFNWKLILSSGLGAGLAYILKNFLSPSSIVITNPSPNAVDAVNKGTAEAKVISNGAGN